MLGSDDWAAAATGMSSNVNRNKGIMRRIDPNLAVATGFPPAGICRSPANRMPEVGDVSVSAVLAKIGQTV
jgi:hypothetical protein